MKTPKHNETENGRNAQEMKEQNTCKLRVINQKIDRLDSDRCVDWLYHDYHVYVYCKSLNRPNTDR